MFALVGCVDEKAGHVAHLEDSDTLPPTIMEVDNSLLE